MKRIIEKGLESLTVKQYIARYVPGLSRRILIDLKKRQDGILVNGQHVTVRYQLQEGDLLELSLEDTEDSNILPVGEMVPVLYEDDSILMVDKPSGMPTHPSHGHLNDSLANTVAGYYRNSGRRFVFRVISRLDRLTSGVVPIAKDHLSAARLGNTITRGGMEKQYVAIVQGKMKGREGAIDRNIKRSQPDRMERCVCDRFQGERAVTRYRVLERYEECTLVRCYPITGRTHQIRVHLSSIGHPIIGDPFYGREENCFPDSIALHCESLTFPHPDDQRKITVTSPLPKRFSDYLSHCHKEQP